MKTFMIKSFGCKVAQYDGDKLREFLINSRLSEDKAANFVIINGCAVTQRAESKARAFARSYKKNNPSATIILYGCIAQKINKFESIQDRYWDHLISHNDFDKLKDILDLTAINNSIIRQNRVRPFIKIHDGCNQFCDYCIVPHLRGREKSLSPDNIIDEIKVYEQYPEVVLTGIHIGRYNHSGLKLSGLLRKIINETTINRIRLSSIEPNELDDEFLELFRDNHRIARYLHIPLQSGSDRILEKMGRPYNTSFFESLISKIRQDNPETLIGTDVIIGYPEETDVDFEESYKLLHKLPIYNIHHFGYSARPNTKAASKKQVFTGEQRKKRINRINELRLLKRQEFMRQYIGNSQQYLVEQVGDDYFQGTSSNYIQILSDNNSLSIGKEYELTGIEIIGEKLLCR